MEHQLDAHLQLQHEPNGSPSHNCYHCLFLCTNANNMGVVRAHEYASRNQLVIRESLSSSFSSGYGRAVVLRVIGRAVYHVLFATSL
jgi:hypothetical protein